MAVPVCHTEEQIDIFEYPTGIWAIAGLPDQDRWIIIHNLEEAKKTGVFHIEVIGREKGQPVWSIKHICNHMAVSAEALRRSVIRPLKTGAVYPESFDTAFAEWKKKAANNEAPVCRTSVTECLEIK
ncbi:MAG: DUF5086 domain-containing protein [Proteobacteria bacterium]|nr:DUF5086 domain-containing protein [Pseudomonadota bacterium]